MVRLYGKGGIQIIDAKGEYRPKDGVLEVPDHLLAMALAAGFSRTPPVPDREPGAAPEIASTEEGTDTSVEELAGVGAAPDPESAPVTAKSGRRR